MMLAFSCLFLSGIYAHRIPDVSKSKTSHPTLIPRTVLVGDKDVYDVQISADGRYVAFLHPYNFQLNIWIWDRSSHGHSPKPITNETTRSIAAFQWLFDNRTIIYAQDSAGEENYRLFAIDVSKRWRKRRILTPDTGVRSILFYVSSTQPNRIAIASNERDPSYFDLYALDLSTNRKEIILINDRRYKSFNIDDSFTVRTAAIETDDGGMDYYLFSRMETPGISLIRSVRPDDRLSTRLITIDYTGRIFYWVDSSEHDLGVLYAHDSITGLSMKLYTAKESEIDFDQTFFHPITNEPLIIYEDYKKLTPVVLGDQSIKKDFDRLRHLLSLDFVPLVLSASADLSAWIVRAVSMKRPAEYIIYYPKNKTHPLVYLFNEKFSILSYSLAETETVQIPISDNFTQICYLTRPLSTVGPSPMVLVVHGGPWMRVSWGFDTTTQTLANRGYLVLQCNFRGSTGFGKRFLNAGNGQWAGKMQDDLTRAVGWAVQRGLARRDRIGIIGSSYGGYAVLTAVTQNPLMYACGIDAFGPSNLSTLFEGIPKYWRAELNSMKRRIGADPDTIAGQALLRQWSPLAHAKRIKRPLLVVHGANDPRVRQIESDMIVKAARANKVNVTYVVFPDEGHSVQQAYNGLALMAIAEHFLAKCLGGRAEPIGDAMMKTSAIIS